MPADFSPFIISIKTSLLSTLIAAVAGVLLANIVVFRKFRGRSVIDALSILPMVLPPTVVGFILLLIFGKNSPVGTFFTSLGVRVVFTWTATVITSTIAALPLVYQTTRAAFLQVDPDLIDAAKILDVPFSKIFFKIILPVSMPGVIAGTVLAFARSLGEFGATIMFAGNIPGRTQTIPLAIYLAVERGDTHIAFFWSAVVILLSIAAIITTNHMNKKASLFRHRHVESGPRLKGVDQL